MPWLAILAGLALVNAFVVWALCRIASDADRRIEAMREELPAPTNVRCYCNASWTQAHARGCPAGAA